MNKLYLHLRGLMNIWIFIITLVAFSSISYADKTISALTATSNALTTDIFPVVQDGTTYKLTLGDMLTNTRYSTINATYGSINTVSSNTLTSPLATITTISTTEISISNYAYAEMATSYNATPLSLSTGRVYTTWNVGLYEVSTINCTVSTKNGTITVLKPGLYKTTYALSFSGSNGNDIHGGCAKGGNVPSPFCEMSATATGAGNFTAMSKSNIHRLVAGDVICIKLENETGANQITIEHGNLIIERIAP